MIKENVKSNKSSKINKIDDISKFLMDNPYMPKIAVAAAEDDDVLNSIKIALKNNIASAVLVGNKAKIIEAAEKVSLDTDQFEIIEANTQEEASKIAVDLVREGKCDILMKGLTSTATLLKAVLNKETGIRGDSILSHFALFECAAYDKMLAATDCAVNTKPTKEQFVQIINNSVKALHELNYENVNTCLIAASEKPNEKIPESIMWNELKSEHKIDAAIIEGPYAIDNAVDEESCEVKGINGKAAGHADLLVFPDLISANVFYKTIVFLGNAKSAGCVVGAKKPIVLTSRADSSEAKFNSICLAIYLATKEKV